MKEGCFQTSSRTPQTQCAVCGSGRWRKLPDPSAYRSITTAGSFVNEPLGKSQCEKCGLIQRTAYPYIGLTDFYETQYDGYYERLGTEAFNRQRYADISRWVSSSIGDFSPRSILEIGCGKGWTLREMKKTYPHANMEGIEPSISNSEEARKDGLRIYSGKLDPTNLPGKGYDLVFSNHVLQHTTDPVMFFETMGKVTTDQGLIVLTVQDASQPSNELLYSDQNFSFLPTHLVTLAKRAGLQVLSWKKAPMTESLQFSQLLLCCKDNLDSKSFAGDCIPETNEDLLNHIFIRRSQYFQAWPRIAEYLSWKTGTAREIYNFGAGMYSFLLACYCEGYWNSVTACTIDNYSGEFVGKRVVPFEGFDLDDRDSIVLGVRPSLQKTLASRIERREWNTICWDNFVAG